MDSSRIGRGVRAIRIRTCLTQQEVATRARVPRGVVARVEHGDLGRLRVEQVLAIAAALRAELDLVLRWNGTDLDRLLNAGHSAMHELVVGMLSTERWAAVPERSFSIWGERGVIDLLAWHAATRSLLVVELKTEIVDVQRLIGTVDRYRRLAPAIARELGWEAATVSTWVAVAESPTNRRRLADHVRVLRAAFPTDGRAIRGWLRSPAGTLQALSFLSDARVASRTAARSSRRRVQTATRASAGPARGSRSDHVASPPSI